MSFLISQPSSIINKPLFQLDRVKQLGVELDGLQLQRAAANDLALKLFKLSSKSDTDAISAEKLVIFKFYFLFCNLLFVRHFL